MNRLTRRSALQATLLGGVAACSAPPTLSPHKAATAGAGGLFAHGVASGDPAADSVVLWTRVTTGDPSAPVDVAFEAATDEAFADVRASGATRTGPDADFTVKVVAAGLEPGRRYFYRFRVGEALSPVGRTKTLPAGATKAATLAFVSCSHFGFGFFNVYDLIARRDDLDAVVHLGDYIYEYGVEGYGGDVAAKLGRLHEPAHEIVSLADYRRRHAQYKADPASQAMHAAHPLIAIWDDHETANDSWSGGADNHDEATEGDWAARKRAALQAYYEWMPIREPATGDPKEAIFRSFSFGDLLTLAALETRLMARDHPLQYDEIVPILTNAGAIDRFRENVLWDAARDMLGDAQVEFVAKTMRASAAAGEPWRIVANQVIMAEVIAPNLKPHVTEEDILELQKLWDQARAFVEFSTLGLPVNLDAWDGYPASRERFYETCAQAGADGLIVVTGDTHTWWANDLKRRDGRAMGVELGVHSVTSASPYRKEFLGGKGAEYALLTAKENASVRYLSGEHHGYIALTLSRDAATARFIAVDTIDGADYNAFEKAAFTIRKSNGVAQFVDVDGLSIEERALF